MIYNILSLTTLVLSFLLGLFVYQSSNNQKINKIFFLLVLSVMLWIFFNFLTDVSTDIFYIQIWSKATIIGVIFFVYFFYNLTRFFPKEKVISGFFGRVILYLSILFLVLVPTSLNIEKVYFLDNQIPAIVVGPLYFFFFFYFSVAIFMSFRNLYIGYAGFDVFEKRQVQYMTMGLGISVLFSTTTNLILPILGNSDLVNYGPYSVLIFIIFTSVAIIKFKLFDIKIITTQLLVISLWIFILIRIFIADTAQEKIINGGLLFVVLIVGIFLIRSVIKEVNLREKIEKLAADLTKANTRLVDLDKQKSEFVSFATHQLRAPLTAMKGYTSLILEGDMGPVTPEVKEAVGRISESSKTLVNIVDDYLNISRIELGTMKYTFDMLDLKEMTNNVIGELKPNIEKKGLNITFTTNPGGPEARFMIHADRDKLKQVISNLIDNSVKYTPSGSLTIFLMKKAADRKIILSIKDTGVGITKAVMPKLFEKFVRAENANKQNIYGTGLGLYVAKQIVNAHKGRIWAESEGEGKGSTFFLELDMEV